MMNERKCIKRVKRHCICYVNSEKNITHVTVNVYKIRIFVPNVSLITKKDTDIS